MLDSISNTTNKIGVEINTTARKNAEGLGICCFDSIEKVADETVSILISNHALEHVDNPVYYVNQFWRVLKKGGRVVICVPHETHSRVNQQDIHMHLYTWSPQNMYNLFSSCNFTVESSRRLTHKWLPNYLLIQQIFGWKGFNALSRIYAILTRNYQTVLVAKKE